LELSLKTQNLPALVAVLLANLALFYGFLLSGSLNVPAAFARLTTWQTAVPGPLTIILVGIITEQFSPEMKARIVYWRWRDPLPGARSFSKYGPQDYRVNMNHIRSLVGSLPESGAEQNRVWYQQLYKKVQDQTAVAGAHKKYLFYRDYSAINLFLTIVLPLVCVWHGTALRAILIYFVILVVQFVLVCNAGRASGIRLVKNVMASV
jgi:hypothetical protein